MIKEDFKAAYVSAFLATYMAGRYDTDCLSGHQNEPYNHQPVEDANFLAERAWESIIKFPELFSTYFSIQTELSLSDQLKYARMAAHVEANYADELSRELSSVKAELSTLKAELATIKGEQ